MDESRIAGSEEIRALLAQVEASAPTLTHTLKRLDELEGTGALDTLLDLAQVVQAAKLSAGDVMIHRVGTMLRQFGELADTLATTLPALQQAAEEARTDSGSVGLFTLLQSLKQPETQFALKFLLALSRRLPALANQ